MIHSLIKYVLVVERIMYSIDSRIPDYCPNILYIIVLGGVYVTGIALIYTYAFFSIWSYKLFLQFVYKYPASIPPEEFIDHEPIKDLLNRFEWVNNECEVKPFLVINLNFANEKLIFSFLRESDLLAYKLMWPNDEINS